jgi:hypothetical protein
VALRAAQVPAPAWWPAVLLVGFRCSTGLGRPAPLLLPIGPPDKCPMLIVTSTIGVRPGGPPLVPPPGGAVVVERTHAMSQRQNGRELRFGSLSLSLSLSVSFPLERPAASFLGAQTKRPDPFSFFIFLRFDHQRVTRRPAPSSCRSCARS